MTFRKYVRSLCIPCQLTTHLLLLSKALFDFLAYIAQRYLVSRAGAFVYGQHSTLPPLQINGLGPEVMRDSATVEGRLYTDMLYLRLVRTGGPV